MHSSHKWKEYPYTSFTVFILTTPAQSRAAWLEGFQASPGWRESPVPMTGTCSPVPQPCSTCSQLPQELPLPPPSTISLALKAFSKSPLIFLFPKCPGPGQVQPSTPCSLHTPCGHPVFLQAGAHAGPQSPVLVPTSYMAYSQAHRVPGPGRT